MTFTDLRLLGFPTTSTGTAFLRLPLSIASSSCHGRNVSVINGMKSKYSPLKSHADGLKPEFLTSCRAHSCLPNRPVNASSRGSAFSIAAASNCQALPWPEQPIFALFKPAQTESHVPGQA
jgi:hypothetical protein